MRCSTGHHKWAVNPPTQGTKCIDCGRSWAPRGFQKRNAVGPTPPPQDSQAPQLGPAAVVSLGGSDRLAAALANLRARSGPPPAPEASGPPAPPPPPPGPSRFAQHMGARLARMFDAATDAAIETMKRRPGEVDETDLSDFEEAAAEIIQRWMPDTELGPYGKLAMSACFIVGGKWVGGEPIARPGLAAAPVAATNTTAPVVVTAGAPVSSSPAPVASAPTPSDVGGL
jgi:hypothetical protein